MPMSVQVRPNYRTAITIPERFWGRFRDIISDFIDQSSTAPAVADTKTEVKQEVEAYAAPASSPPAASGN